MSATAVCSNGLLPPLQQQPHCSLSPSPSLPLSLSSIQNSSKTPLHSTLNSHHQQQQQQQQQQQSPSKALSTNNELPLKTPFTNNESLSKTPSANDSLSTNFTPKDMPSSLDSLSPAFEGFVFKSPVGPVCLSQQLASGSYGMVWLAHTPDAQYAVKILFKYGLDDRQLQIQALEHSLHAQVSDHPNIVSLLHVHETQKHVFLLLDWFKDGDLFDALVDTSVFSTPLESLEAFLQICNAIKHCHDAGIAHRDLKPENILLARVDDAVNAGAKYHLAVSDFGLAINAPWSTEFGCGSVRYESPECLAPIRPTTTGYATLPADVWSLGVILINLLVGKNPWCEPSSHRDEMYSEYVADRRAFLARHFPTVGALGCGIDALILGCLDPDVRMRWGIAKVCARVRDVVRRLVPPDSAVCMAPPPMHDFGDVAWDEVEDLDFPGGPYVDETGNAEAVAAVPADVVDVTTSANIKSTANVKVTANPETTANVKTTMNVKTTTNVIKTNPKTMANQKTTTTANQKTTTTTNGKNKKKKISAPRYEPEEEGDDTLVAPDSVKQQQKPPRRRHRKRPHNRVPRASAPPHVATHPAAVVGVQDEAEGMMLKVAAAFSKLLSPVGGGGGGSNKSLNNMAARSGGVGAATASRGSADAMPDASSGVSVRGFRMTFL